MYHQPPDCPTTCSNPSACRSISEYLNGKTAFKVSVLEGGTAPVRRYNSIGYDLYPDRDYIIEPNSVAEVKTALRIEIPSLTVENSSINLQVYGRIAPRSSLSRHPYLVLAGVIDSDYRGEVIAMIYNLNPAKQLVLKKTSAVAQLILEVAITPTLKLVKDDELSITKRGSSGFGSTNN